MIRAAPFIWTPEQPADDNVSFLTLLRDGAPRREDGQNRWFLFRRVFELPFEPEEATVDMTADGRFVLFVNGVQACRGPVRCSPERQRVERRSVAPLLRSGTNVLAVLVHVYGADMGWYQRAKGPWQTVFGDGALYCDLAVRGTKERLQVQSDTQWRCIACNAWKRDTPRAGWGQDFIEDFDARSMPEGWQAPEFDDSAWPQAEVRRTDPTDIDLRKGWGPVEPFPVLVESEMPPQHERPAWPSQVVAVYGLVPDANLAIDERIYRERLTDLPANGIDDAQGLVDGKAVVVRTAPGADTGILLKFDPLICGYPTFEISGNGGEIVELAAGETIPGEYTGNLPQQPRLLRETYLDCAHVARYTARPGRQRFEKFDWTAIRYLLVVVRNAPDGLTIHSAGAVQTAYPVEESGEFRCSDPFLEDLWRIGRYTALQCTHDGWVDGPGREKRQWLGDGIVHYLISAAAFGPGTEAVDRQFVVQAAENRRPDGLLPMFFPGDHHEHSLVIPDFNLHWIMTVHHYLMHSGDRDVVAGVYPTIETVLQWFALQAGPNGLLADLPHWNFVEWANVRRDGESAILNAMYVGALRAAAETAGHLGYGRARERHLRQAARITATLGERHWDPERELYVDTVNPRSGERGDRVSQHANAAMILWDIAPRKRWTGIVERITDPERLRVTAAPPIVLSEQDFDPRRHIVRANTFFGFFVNEALARAGRFDLALASIRNFYRPMLESGTSTLWESNEPHASTCHAFSAGPVYHLSTHALGVRPLRPGFAEFQVALQPGNLDFAEGSYPTPEGVVTIAWKRTVDAFTLRLGVPGKAQGRIVPPPGYMPGGVVSVGPGEHERVFLVDSDQGAAR